MMQQRGVTVNCVHPGIIATNVLRDGWGGGGSDAKVSCLTVASCYSVHHCSMLPYFSSHSPDVLMISEVISCLVAALG